MTHLKSIRPHFQVLGLLILGLILVAGCASTGKSVATGAVLGGAMGSGVGALADPGKGGAHRLRNVVIGTAVVSAVGVGAGFALDHVAQDERKESYAQGKKDAEASAEGHAASVSGNPPKLTPARTEARWVPDQVRGTTFIPGHFEYMIIETARWERAQ